MPLEPTAAGVQQPVIRVVCSSCGWLGTDCERLSAQNPFEPEFTLTACPKCKAIESCLTVCDVPTCRAVATCGTPTAERYRWTCGKHRPG
jgi:hypothetical protein